ncbi:MAG: hypothetical protein EXQ51_11730 [Acidobacteria bacterium]|nr:hypothetical protein [Acidobacteriota bacterium]
MNGGEVWTKLPTPAGAEKRDFRDLDAVSDRVAYALSIGSGETSRIYKTADGGMTWALQFANTDPKVAVFGANHIWIGMTASRVLRSGDAGRTWAIATNRLYLASQ